MRQVKRLFYIILLNVIISATTVVVILKLWERDHPPVVADNTPIVIVVTPTKSVSLPLMGTDTGLDSITTLLAGAEMTGTLQATPTIEMLSYRIKAGDTLGALAVEFNVGIDDILIANGLTDPDNIYVGQIIYIPTAPLPKPTSTSLPPTIVASPTIRPSATVTRGPTPTVTLTPVFQEPQMVVESVIGVGVLINEHVVLKRTGDGELSLAGWRLEDGKGNKYTFPDLILYKGGTINVNTRSGEDTVLDLFWGLSHSIWSSGKTIYLYDSQNELRTSYTIP